MAKVGAEAAEHQRAIDRALALGYQIAKADKPPQVAVYDADGNLVGTVDEDDIIRVAAAEAPDANKPTTRQAPTDGSMPTQPAAKAMSLGAQGQHQLGGRTPRGGVPVVPAQDAADQQDQVAKTLRKSVDVGRVLKGRLDPASGASAAERVEAMDGMQTLAMAAFGLIRTRGANVR